MPFGDKLVNDKFIDFVIWIWIIYFIWWFWVINRI